MAEAAVESPVVSQRFYCHQCSSEISPKLPDLVCPTCDGGFVEQMADEPEQISLPSSIDLDPAAQFTELWRRAFFESFRQNAMPRDDSSDSTSLESSSNPTNSSESQLPYQTITIPSGTRISIRSRGQGSGGVQARNPIISYARNIYPVRLVNYFLSRLGGEHTGAPINMLQLHANPGDYAWGTGGLDTIITQLLNQLEGAGAPPADREKIESLPKVKITERQVVLVLQCSVCMEDFKLDEEVRKLPCDHHYHKECIEKWLELHGTCPVCRKDLNGEDAYVKDHESEDEFRYLDSDHSSNSDSESVHVEHTN
ncbi:E3 ubiquitin-protein ligase RNF115-like isoform X2 [Gigantopelta aegis]|uniref:E3 ubiquitin-protein ligase RNF115-like isoform X2 n=1 Tax=Gigantopelta aegis TaxID=1735272 RepID=UPI001B88BA66|nr:E3 ubiquitin-protein ligase RNF115-like isoform X2 [Gigantopelta aegis]